MNAPTPTVIYTDAAELPVVGGRMRVQVLNHPRFMPGEWVTTGRVTFVRGERFLTDRTAYIPGIRDDADNLTRLTRAAMKTGKRIY
jgi:hypothetical protein